MARKKLKQPSDSKTSDERKKIKEHPHFDFDCDVFAKDHYGVYLIVKNSSKADRSRQHNRFYLDSEKELEFLLKTGYGQRGLTTENYKSSDRHLFSIHSTHKTLIQTLISKVKRHEKRNTVRDLIYGINTMISLFEESNKSIPDNPYEFSAEIHQKCLLDSILEGRVTIQNHIRNLGAAWAYIRTFFENSTLGILPSQPSAQTQIKQLILKEGEDEQIFFDEKEGKDEITLELLFQLDYYSQIELEHIIDRRKEYLKWMSELDKHGELFSRANLLRTYYDGNNHQILRKLYILLYKEDPRCWDSDKMRQKRINGKNKRIPVYANEADEIRHKELITISKTGINISIKTEKMFAWWQKTMFPEWPFVRTVAKPYDKVLIEKMVGLKNMLVSLKYH